MPRVLQEGHWWSGSVHPIRVFQEELAVCGVASVRFVLRTREGGLGWYTPRLALSPLNTGGISEVHTETVQGENFSAVLRASVLFCTSWIK